MLRVGLLFAAAKAGTWSLPDVNLLLNLLGLVGILYFGLKYLKRKDWEAQLLAKDRAIATNDQTIKAQDARITSLEDDLQGAQERAERAVERSRKHQDAAQYLQGKYEEQSKYTAREALITLESLLSRQGEEAERRHLELMSALGSIKNGA